MTEMASLVLYAGDPTATAAFYRASPRPVPGKEQHGEQHKTGPQPHGHGPVRPARHPWPADCGLRHLSPVTRGDIL